MLKNTGKTWLTSLTSALLATDQNGLVIATSSIGADKITGILGIANGGTNASSFTTANNAAYYDGTRLVTAGTSQAVTLPYASSTALTVSGHCVTGETRIMARRRRRRRRSDGSIEDYFDDPSEIPIKDLKTGDLVF